MTGLPADKKAFVTRFAPSPTGFLHKGHGFSALMAFRAAEAAGGRFLLRIEDIDTGRCRPEYVEAIYRDLTWLGLRWEEPVRIQSAHFDDYGQAVLSLKNMGVVYPCFCTRKEILTEIATSPSAPHGPDGPLYPGTCRRLDPDTATARIAAGQSHAWRLDLAKALEITGSGLMWHDAKKGPIKARPQMLGDVVLARKDIPTSYHLSVVVDDGIQKITDIVRGEDLFHATHIHVVLQKLLDLPTPRYDHHPLLTDESGVRFAKRNKALTLASIRESGVSAEELIHSLAGDRTP